jgi:hypothetical protein
MPSNEIDHLRRRIVFGIPLGLSAALLPSDSRAEHVCVQRIVNNIPLQVCDARIPSKKFKHFTQPLSYWCWAATLQMICFAHGYQISQPSIVRQTFGAVVNMPADPITLINSVNRDYVDDMGRSFSLNSNVWSQIHGLSNTNNAAAMQQLAAEKPLVVCNKSHMMVLIGMSYLIYPNGAQQVQSAWVADPMVTGVTPSGNLEQLAPGFRYLSIPEMVPVSVGGQLTFVAEVYVS